MIRVVFSDGREFLTDKGRLLSDILKSAGVALDLPCGGIGKCGKCKTDVAILNKNQKEKIEKVLACSYKVDNDLWVDVETANKKTESIILTSRSKVNTQTDSGISKHFVSAQDLAGLNLPIKGAYWEQLVPVLSSRDIKVEPSLPVLQRFSYILSANGISGGITLVTADNRLLGIEAGDTTGKCYGLAVDLGTTTVVGYLIDLLTGRELAVGGQLNGQRIYGADVISRITAVQNRESTLQELQQQAINTVNNIINDVTSKAGIEKDNIYLITVAGNTCMHHLFLGLNPANLARSPFLPYLQQDMVVEARQLGLGVNPQGQVWLFPVIAGFVGGDTTSAILATNLHLEGKRILMDIGTNGELAVNANGTIMVCSAAAGPALEGAQIEFGMRAETGAISRLRLSPDIRIEVIGGGRAKGMCGSALVDLMAELVREGLVNKRGRLEIPEQYTGPEYLKKRLIKGEKGYRFVVLSQDENDGHEIYLSQEDISQLQLAKGALRAAAELLVRKIGIQGDELEELLLAGAFGNFIDIERAHIIGLLPKWVEGKVKPVGNAAGEGARIALLSRAKRKEAWGIARSAKFLELAGTSDFNNAFIKGMLFT